MQFAALRWIFNSGQVAFTVLSHVEVVFARLGSLRQTGERSRVCISPRKPTASGLYRVLTRLTMKMRRPLTAMETHTRRSSVLFTDIRGRYGIRLALTIPATELPLSNLWYLIDPIASSPYLGLTLHLSSGTKGNRLQTSQTTAYCVTQCCSSHPRHTLPQATPTPPCYKTMAAGVGGCYRGGLSVHAPGHYRPDRASHSRAAYLYQYRASSMIDLPNRLRMRLSRWRSVPRGDCVSHGHHICYLYPRT